MNPFFEKEGWVFAFDGRLQQDFSMFYSESKSPSNAPDMFRKKHRERALLGEVEVLSGITTVTPSS